MHQLLFPVLRLLLLISLEIIGFCMELAVVASLCEVILHVNLVNLVKRLLII